MKSRLVLDQQGAEGAMTYFDKSTLTEGRRCHARFNMQGRLIADKVTNTLMIQKLLNHS